MAYNRKAVVPALAIQDVEDAARQQELQDAVGGGWWREGKRISDPPPSRLEHMESEERIKMQGRGKIGRKRPKDLLLERERARLHPIEVGGPMPEPGERRIVGAEPRPDISELNFFKRYQGQDPKHTGKMTTHGVPFWQAPDGSYYSEKSITVELESGEVVNFSTVNPETGRTLPPRAAFELAKKAGKLRVYPDIPTAVAAAEKRSRGLDREAAARFPGEQNRFATELDIDKIAREAGGAAPTQEPEGVWWTGAVKELVDREGFKGLAYEAPEWKKEGDPLTVGYGHLLADDDAAKAVWEKAFKGKISRSAVIAKTRELTEEEGKMLLEEDMRSRLDIIKRKGNLPDFDTLPDKLKIGSLSLWFQGGLAGSPDTLEAIKDAQKTNSPRAWQRAAKEFLNRGDYLKLTGPDDFRPGMPEMARWAPGLEQRYEQFAKDLWHMDTDPDYNLPAALDAGIRPLKKGAPWPTEVPATQEIWHMDKKFPKGGYYETVENLNAGESLIISGR